MKPRQAKRTALCAAILSACALVCVSSDVIATVRASNSGHFAGGGSQTVPGSPGGGALLSKAQATNAPARPLTMCRD
jgi:hypothetical protein